MNDIIKAVNNIASIVVIISAMTERLASSRSESGDHWVDTIVMMATM